MLLMKRYQILIERQKSIQDRLLLSSLAGKLERKISFLIYLKIVLSSIIEKKEYA